MKKFQAKCKNAYLIKLLAEVLNNNLKTGCFEFNKNGIYLKMMDDRKHILIDIALPKDQFYLYNYDFNTTQHIGVNLCHLYKMIKSVKKKDTIEIFIDSEDLTDLGIKVTSNNSTRTSCSFIKIQSIQNLEIESPSGYSYTYLIPSSNFGKMCKEMYSIDSKIDITWEEAIKDAKPAECEKMNANDYAYILYTSGTTGSPKGVMLSSKNLQAMVEGYLSDVDSVSSSDTALYSAPMSHGAGLYNVIFVKLGARHSVPISGRFDPLEVLKLSLKLKSVCMFLAPTMVNRLVRQAEKSMSSVEGIRTIIYGGGPMYLADITSLLWFVTLL